jgi:hypothetical protein
MIKKIVLLLLTIICFIACFEDNNEGSFALVELPVDSYSVPDSFTFGEKDTITVNYTLPDGCHSFNNLFYQRQDTARVVAVSVFLDLDGECAEILRTEEYKFVVTASQEEDYLFKFYKGLDDDGKNIFEEVTVPVN